MPRSRPPRTETLQAVRLLDVFLIGPLMVYVAAKADTVPTPARYALGIVGVSSMLFNGKNYLRTRTP